MNKVIKIAISFVDKYGSYCTHSFYSENDIKRYFYNGVEVLVSASEREIKEVEISTQNKETKEIIVVLIQL